MKSIVAVAFTLFATLVSDVSAAALDVYVPPILTPVAGDVWPVGSQQTVTWDTSNPPKQITNQKGQIVLSKGGRFVSGAGGLDQPLASGFDILSGSQTITVPNVADGDDYAVVLFGDSGNASPSFSITSSS